ncbi:MAG: substrate binding domain-containing protein, partial [Hyphomicrobiales bacterium]|nr:substrate binding domain-containing protein [Hyphomicrobiales bacterium]
LQLALIASPGYLAERGTPVSPDDLRNHNCVIDTAAPYRDRWPLKIDGAVNRYHVKGNVSVNSGSAARRLVVGGVGLALLPEYLVFDDIEKQRLVTVLDEHVIDFGGIFIVYPQSRHQSSAIRSFADLLMEHTKPIRHYREKQMAKRLKQAQPD